MMTEDGSQTIFEVLPGRSAVLVKARSNVGPISFATSDVHGEISAGTDGGSVDASAPVKARLSVGLQSLTSGNALYDTELRRRIHARRYPVAVLELERAVHQEGTNHYELTARIEIHEVVRHIGGIVTIDPLGHGGLVVRGQQKLDIRDFELEVPTTLALKIYPEVSVEMHLEARPSERTGGGAWD
jgi:polyisoprenoid-binding protein YceI